MSQNRITSFHERGVDVHIAVRKKITPSPLYVTEICVEQTFGSFSTDNLNIIICGVYLPPSCSSKIYKAHFFSFIALVLQHSTHSFITCSDYMFPSVSWSNNNHDLCYFSQRGSQHLCVPEFLALNGFF